MDVDVSKLPADGSASFSSPLFLPFSLLTLLHRAAHNPWPNFKYTGALRPVYPNTPVPKREIPENVVKPDHANNVDGISFLERVANRTERAGKVLEKDEQEKMKVVCKLAREVLDIAAAAIKPGVTTLEIDEIVHDECMKRERYAAVTCELSISPADFPSAAHPYSYPSPLNYHRFPRSVCTSINEVICHGSYSSFRPLLEPMLTLSLSQVFPTLEYSSRATSSTSTSPSTTTVFTPTSTRPVRPSFLSFCPLACSPPPRSQTPSVPSLLKTSTSSRAPASASTSAFALPSPGFNTRTLDGSSRILRRSEGLRRTELSSVMV